MADQGFTDWLAGQGLALPNVAPTAAVLRQVGSDYVDAAYEHRLACSHRAGGYLQERAWPRTGHRQGRNDVPDDMIPPAWVNASYRAGYLQATQPGWATGAVDPGRITKREKADVIEREFFGPDVMAAGDAAPGMRADAVVNGLVLPWLCAAGRRSPDTLFRVI
jgi:hypothetical protein